MKFQVYPKGIWIEVADFNVQAIETSMSGETMIVHAPGLQFPVLNGVEFIESDAFERDFVEMSPQRWIRASAVRSIQRVGDEYVRVTLDGVRQFFDLFPGDASLKQVYKEFQNKLPSAPSFLSLEVAA
jgi:hypothetical protein